MTPTWHWHGPFGSDSDFEACIPQRLALPLPCPVLTAGHHTTDSLPTVVCDPSNKAAALCMWIPTLHCRCLHSLSTPSPCTVSLVLPPQLGIIPTDSLPAVVCDLNNKAAALKLFNVMELAPKKQLSILVGGFNDISTYTTGAHCNSCVNRRGWVPCMCVCSGCMTAGA